MSEPSAPSEGPFPQIRQRVQEWLESDTPATQVERDRFTLLERVDKLTREVQEHPTTVHVATPEGITPCGEGERDVPVAALIAEATCVECLRAVALEKGALVVECRLELEEALGAERGTHWPGLLRQVEELRARGEEAPESTDADRHDPTVCTHLACLTCRVAQLERDSGGIQEFIGISADMHDAHSADARSLTNRLDLLEVAQGRVDRLHDRVDALELAAREHHQSGGAEHVRVAGGSAPRPCPSTAYNPQVFIDMVCAYDLGHLSPHYNPASGGWTWDNDENVTQLDGRTPTHLKDGS